MENFSNTVQALKTQHNQNKDMTEESVRVDTEVDEEVWNELTEFIDEHKSTRRSGKKWYAQKIIEMALLRKREFEEESGDVLDILKE